MARPDGSLKIKTGLVSRETYKFKKKPYKHQVQAVTSLLETGWGGALLMEPRTGKTKVGVDWVSILHQRGRVNRVLVICPVSAMDSWIREIKESCPAHWRITIWDRDGRKAVSLPPLGQDRLDFVLINYDAFSTAGIQTRGRDGEMKRRRRGGRFAVRQAVKRWQPQACILDESHRIKTPSSQKTKMIASLAWEWEKGRVGTKPTKCLIPFRAILTGTVVTKKKRIFDIYSQWKLFLNPMNPMVKGKTLGEFKAENSVMTDRHGYPQWLRNRPAQIKQLRRHMHSESFTITRDECYDLPPRYPDEIVHVPLTGETARLYDELTEQMVAQLQSGEITQAQLKIVLRTRLLQLTSGIARVDPTPAHPRGRLVRVGNDKLNMFQDRMVDFFEAEQKVVTAARWTDDISTISQMCLRLKIPYRTIAGGQKRDDRVSGIDWFNEHDGAAMMIVQPTAGAEGIDLRSSAIFSWYSMTDSWVSYKQVEDRIALSPKATSYLYFLGESTIDEIVYESLQEDTDVAKMITKRPERLLRKLA